MLVKRLYVSQEWIDDHVIIWEFAEKFIKRELKKAFGEEFMNLVGETSQKIIDGQPVQHPIGILNEKAAD